MSESEPTEQLSVEKTEVTDGANGAEVTEAGDSAPESDVRTQEPADTEPAAETENESDGETEPESEAESVTEPVAETETESTTEAELEEETEAETEAGPEAGPETEVRDAVDGEQPTQVVPAQAAASPPQDLGFAPLGDAVPATAAPAAGAPAAQAAAYPAQAYAHQAPAGPGAPGVPGQFQPPAQPSYGAFPAYAYGPMAVGTPPEATVDPAIKKRKRKRVLWTVAAVVVLGGLIGGGVYALLPGRTGNSVVVAVKCQPTALAGCLIKAPDGAIPLTTESSTGDKWPQQTAVTVNEFASHIILDSPGVQDDAATELSADSAKLVVHNDWNAVDGSNVDLALISFGTQQGAQSWNSTRSGEILAGYQGQTVSVPGDSTGAAHVAVKKDDQGNIHAAYSVVVGDLVLNVAYSSPSPFNAQDLANWAGTELASLRTAPPAPADPAPAPVGTQQVACQSRLNSCLESVPDGGQPWGSATDPNWLSNSTLSPAQFVHVFWDKSSASGESEVLSGFTSNGVTGIGHEDWYLGDASEQADIYLIQTITAAGASNLAQADFGDPDWGGGRHGISYSVPGLSEVQLWYTNKTDSDGLIESEFDATIGNVIITGSMNFAGSFESNFVNSWIKDQVDSVTATEKTEPVGQFSLSAPTLAAPSQGSCAPSGDCLLPLPGGAKDTTSSSYQDTQSLSAAQYTINYETAASAETANWLASDGFQSGEHRSWTASNGATADVAVLKYAKPAEAKAAVLLEYGLNAVGDRVCTDSAVPDSYCLAEPVSVNDPLLKQTIWVTAWKGDYEVSALVTLSNSADVAQAYTWVQQQLDMLPAS